MQTILIVDGYNMIGAWKELRPLRETNFEEARNHLLDLMAEYKAALGCRVIVVFDAHLVPGAQQNYVKNAVEIIYTRKNETADECIEKLTNELKGRKVQIYVATSDLTEQNVIFGNGALRKSARELEIEMAIIKSNISQEVKKMTHEEKPKSRIQLSEEVELAFEKWRRGLK
ncbi:NYN domain-containing protein [Ureibacillus sp. Re31]|uniref:NYN domain-containing protein n=1 Tax=Ureibacillus galli TaxID=2762222 RepID=A0ABR8XDD7_9BACL|nr:NYN domain-containing protein [Ureibacillus galli]MBD8027235.1 NYN domain-containing protein [Ureibacillus galli]